MSTQRCRLLKVLAMVAGQISIVWLISSCGDGEEFKKKIAVDRRPQS
jgi:hypothetical protein